MNPTIDEMISGARERIPPKPKPFPWWKEPSADEELENIKAEEEPEENKNIKYIHGARPVEKGGNYEESED